MRKIILSSLLLLACLSVNYINAQPIIPNSEITGVCYAGNKINRIYIPPPKKFFAKSGEKNAEKITVYYTNFPQDAVTAMEYAVSILESILPSDTRFKISARWENIQSVGVLGNSAINGFVAGWSIDAINPFAYYPYSLAEKIAGRELNDTLTGDFILTMNSEINWYLGTDGNTPALAYDFVTVVLHEVCHGLGFFDSMSTDNSIGWYGWNSIPTIYDTFIENLSGSRLTDTLVFTNYSPQLYNEMTGGQLYFNGPIIKNYTGGLRARLYAPSTWDPGSSISHLDEILTPDVNALMTPFISKGEAIHDPGNYTLAMLGDLGWINTRIIHKPPEDTEELLTELNLSATIKSDTSYNRDKVGLVYSFDNFSSFDTIYLESKNNDNIFDTTLNITIYNTELQYYFIVEDYFKRLYRSPSVADYVRYSVYIGTDTVKPKIIHTPVDYYLETVDSIIIIATATDNIGIDTVYIEYMINEGPSKFIGLVRKDSSDIYTAVINAKEELLEGGDSIQYRIIAEDKSLLSNSTTLPESGYFVIRIEDLKDVVTSYSTQFGPEDGDFFNIGFDVSLQEGFSNHALNTKHPYESSETDNNNIEYTSMLRYPLIFDESGMLISYDEVVLVEPGESGSLFGSEDFYDYVIVEGSKDFGKSWFSLADGYDSRYQESWELTYNSYFEGQNSLSIGTASMLKNHSIYYSENENISAGDTFLIRFRLFSDPYAYGWGWIIDDLSINPLIDSVEDLNYNNIQFKIYPNPGNGVITIDPGLDSSYNEKLRYNVFGYTGKVIMSGYISTDQNTTIDISSYPEGFYTIALYFGNNIKTIKYIYIE